MKKKFFINKYFSNHKELFDKLDLKKIIFISELIIRSTNKGGKIYTCGNGGSAYNASHFVTDWNKFIPNVNKKFSSISLCDNLGFITATGNDLKYDDIFFEQIKNCFSKKDILICISGSGNSKNLLKVAKHVRKKNGKVISLIGFDGGKLKKLSNHYIHVPSYDMQLCEDIHLMIGHIIMKHICDTKVF